MWTFSELLIGMLILAGVLLLLFVIGSIRWPIRKGEKTILATVTSIQLEATAWRSHWRITAVWQDTTTGQTYTFRGRGKYRPKQQVGDTVTVICNPNQPKRFRMEL
jgi:hypothetical protein